ncbi:chemotaxis protein CheA [Hyphococcus sp.]|jgi:two-component system chemotaxis sensor kinase CheA|uniref:chemotaxis protein CheA n=1 Tax=Hyphococcus sp. TaxID=2038636 RepID=UPI003D0E48E4
MDPMEEIKQTFFIECEDLLEELEHGLMAMNDGSADAETVNAVFRAAHSIKGGAGAFALDDLVRFAHKFETTLDEVRQDRLEATADVMKVFLRSGDMLADLVHNSRDGVEIDAGAVDELIAELESFCNPDGAPAEPEEKPDFQPMALALDLDLDLGEETESAAPQLNVFNIVFRPRKELYANGNETSFLLRALTDLGTVETECDYSKVPLLDDIDPEGACLEWRIAVTTEFDEAQVREVFDFVESDCDLEITQGESVSAPEKSAEIEPEAEEETASLGKSEAPAEAAAPEPAPVLESAPSASNAQVEKNAAASDKSGGAKATIRVDLDRVDRLINLVGELVINQAMVSQCVEEAGLAANSSVATGLDEFNQLTREIQESVMAIRAQPVKSLFQRMSRIVREAANATGKTVRLVTDGETTEVDKTVIERLADPLTHMIRNAVDHGLEKPQDRLAKNKPEEGLIRLTAAHRSGRVVIDIVDDGAGINRERVKQIAVEKGLISADAVLSDSEIDNLLFMPGFSTAKEVSNLSGRGVGMDVVKRAIQALGGRIAISSTPGKGSTFSISLPLTLAVLDGMVVRVADQTFVAPLSAIVETFKPEPSYIHTVGDGSDVVSVRGSFVPIVDLGALLGFREPLENYNHKVILLVENANGVRSALVVDNIQDQRQVVIKGLEDNYGHVPDIAAATILGDGRIALILDTDSLITSPANKGGLPEAELALAG